MYNFLFYIFLIFIYKKLKELLFLVVLKNKLYFLIKYLEKNKNKI